MFIPTPRGCSLARREIVRDITTTTFSWCGRLLFLCSRNSQCIQSPADSILVFFINTEYMYIYIYIYNWKKSTDPHLDIMNLFQLATPY